jgi:hypothetical protein
VRRGDEREGRERERESYSGAPEQRERMRDDIHVSRESEFLLVV